MEQKPERDLQTISLFVILAFLTSALVFGARLVLFAPTENKSVPNNPQIEKAQR